jgi:2-methylcitrate dehydratase PrpD
METPKAVVTSPVRTTPVACGLIEDFVRSLRWSDVPAPVQRRVRHLLADFAAVSVAGRAAPAARIAADHAAAVHPGADATALLDGRRLGVLGAAWSNGVLANALDMDDGHRLTKGHAGANVIPAALATAQLAGASEERLLAAVVVGYEVAIRAGIALHARDPAYHASGAWGAMGAAAAAASLLELPAGAVRDAIGLAEYHAPIAGIMRSVAEPAMTKDACGHGAWLGVNAALLARRGFTSLPAEFLAGDIDDVGTDWRLLEVYVKAYPCCRWSQGAVHAALSLRAPATREIERVRITTFAAAAALARVSPTTTEEAQYNLVWPVATALVKGDFGVGAVLGPFGDPAVDALAGRVEVEIDPRMEAAFPQRRLSAVTLELRHGRRLASEVVEAPGEPEDPAWEEIVAGKVERLVGTPPPTGTSHGLAGLSAYELIGVLARAGGGHV